jgi:hypothetical protein
MIPSPFARALRHATLAGAALVALACAGRHATPAAAPVDVSVPSAASASASAAPAPSGAAPCPMPETVTGLGRDETCRSEPACERACRDGAATSCVTAGNLDSSAAHPDAERQLRVYARACSLGNVLGCTNYGATLRLGHRDPAQLACAARLFALACDHAEAYGCAMLGGAYAMGEGVPRDGSKALEALLKGCKRGLAHPDGVAMACENLIALLHGVPHGSSPALMHKALHDAEDIGCDAGSAKACAALGRATPP